MKALLAALLGSTLITAPIHVIDGDTVRAGGQTYRLIGFDTPETGDRATRRFQFFPPASVQGFPPLPPGGLGGAVGQAPPPYLLCMWGSNIFSQKSRGGRIL